MSVHLRQHFVILTLSFAAMGTATAQHTLQREALDRGVTRWTLEGRSDASTSAFWQLMRRVKDLVLPSQETLPFEKTVAFLVGVSDYDHAGFEDLPFVAHDLQDMRDFLLTNGGVDEVYEVSGASATPSTVSYYMSRYFKDRLTPRDRLLFYYSGHGGDADGTTGYMLFANAVPGEYWDTNAVLPISSVREWSSVIEARHVLFLIDACSSGLGISPTRRSENDTYAVVNALSGEGSRYVLTAGTGDQKTFEVASSNGRGNGVFTRALLNAFEKSRETNNFYTVASLFGFIVDEIGLFSARYEKELTPVMYQLDDLAGTFVFLDYKNREPLSFEESNALRVTSRGASIEKTKDEWRNEAAQQALALDETRRVLEADSVGYFDRENFLLAIEVQASADSLFNAGVTIGNFINAAGLYQEAHGLLQSVRSTTQCARANLYRIMHAITPRVEGSLVENDRQGWLNLIAVTDSLDPAEIDALDDEIDMLFEAVREARTVHRAQLLWSGSWHIEPVYDRCPNRYTTTAELTLSFTDRVGKEWTLHRPYRWAFARDAAGWNIIAFGVQHELITH